MRILSVSALFFLSIFYSYSSYAQSDSSHLHSSHLKVDSSQLKKDASILKAEKIRKRLLKGESFCELAKEFSEDYASLVVCGEIGYFKKGVLVPEYEEASLKLKPGEISPIIRSHYGYHIIQLIAIKYDENNHLSFDTRHILIKHSGL